jgi:hypothetical protein
MIRSEFAIVRVDTDKVLIRDLNRGAMSVTNDAERVVESLFNNFGNRKFIYQDSMGEWSELLHENGTFKDFGLSTDSEGNYI